MAVSLASLLDEIPDLIFDLFKYIHVKLSQKPYIKVQFQEFLMCLALTELALMRKRLEW